MFAHGTHQSMFIALYRVTVELVACETPILWIALTGQGEIDIYNNRQTAIPDDVECICSAFNVERNLQTANFLLALHVDIFRVKHQDAKLMRRMTTKADEN